LLLDCACALKATMEEKLPKRAQKANWIDPAMPEEAMVFANHKGSGDGQRDLRRFKSWITTRKHPQPTLERFDLPP
jgi:hypothetical protein